MSATTSGTVDDIVNRFQAVRVLEFSAKVVGLGAEFAVVAVECEEIVQSISERYTAVVQDGTDGAVLAECIGTVGIRGTKACVPVAPLRATVSFRVTIGFCVRLRYLLVDSRSHPSRLGGNDRHTVGLESQSFRPAL